MTPMTVSEITAACGGILRGDRALFAREVTSVTIDSRTACPGALYVPILGERFDGHAFIDAARQNGALLALSDRDLPGDAPYILVRDTLTALQNLARHYREKFDIPVIGVTGSVGKTSTKEMLVGVLGRRYRVLGTHGSQNNQTGVPLTLFRLEKEHEVAVVEMGTNHFGEIETLAKIAEPTVCLFTNIGVAHIEFFGSREGILRGKTDMLAGMREGGAVIVNGDDDMLVRVPGAFRFGTDAACDLRADEIADEGLHGMTFTAHYREQAVRMHVPAPGRHAVMNALAAAAVGLQLGMPLSELALGVAAYEAPAGRMCVRKSDRFTVLDDCYNANPTSAMASIDVLSKVDGRRVCILGDMLELGDQSAEYHEVTGRYAARHGIDLVLCVGPMSEHTFLGAHAEHPRRARYFEAQDSLLDILPVLVRDGDTILVKASRGMHLEKTVDMLLHLGPASEN